MGIPATLSSVPSTPPYIQYIATNGQTVFPYPFVITQDSDLFVVINGVTSPTDSGYSLSGVGNSTGGNVTFTSGQTAGAIITLYRQIAIQRITQIGQNSGFSSTAFNAEYNNIYLIMQQLQEAAVFTLQIPSTNSGSPVTTLTPANYANKYLSFDANGNPQPATLVTGTQTAATIGGLITPQTQAEVNASITPLTQYPLGDMRRYGIVPNNVGAAANNTTFMKALFNPAVAGPTGRFYFPNTTGSDVYSFGGTCPIRPQVSIDLGGCTISFIGAATANDVNVGLFYALSDFELYNGTINTTVDTTLGTNAGSAVFIGARGTGFYFTVLESTYSGPSLGRIVLKKLIINNTNTGGNSGHCIGGVGGFSNVVMDDITINCNSVLGGAGLAPVLGIYLEYGYWSGTGAVPSGTLVTSHAKNMLFRNIRVLNSGDAGLGLTGCYNTVVDGLYTNGCAKCFVYSVGQAMFYNISPNDTAGQKRSMTLRNIVGQGCTSLGVLLAGSNTQGGFTAQQQTDLMSFDVDGLAIQATGVSSGGMTVSGNITARNVILDLQGGGGTNPLLISPDVMYAKFENSRFLGGAGAGIRADTSSTYWSPTRQRFIEINGCQIAGNLSGISVLGVQACKLTECRIGYNSLYDGVGNEATQTLGVSVASGGNGVICDSCVVTTAGGGAAYSITGVNSSGCNVINPILIANGTVTTAGNWDINGVSQAAAGTASSGSNTAGFANKTSYPNIGYKYAGKLALNTSNGVLYRASGSLSTDTWVPVYGTSLFATLTPA